MKKLIFALFCLSPYFTYTKTSGMITNDTTLYLHPFEYLQKNRFEMFMGENSDFYSFMQGQFTNFDKEDSFHKIGLRYDKELDKNLNLTLFLGYNKNNSFEKDFLNHLTLKNKYSPNMNHFQKIDTLKRNAYFYDKKSSLLSSFSLKSNLKNTDFYGSLGYLKKENKDFRLLSYFETNSALNYGFLNFKLEHDYDLEKKDGKEIYGKYTKKNNLITAKNYGSLKGDIKFSSSRLLDKTYFYNQLKFDLKSGILKDEKGDRVVEIENKNYFKYTPNNNIELITKLDLKNEITKDSTNNRIYTNERKLSLTLNPVYNSKKLENDFKFKINFTHQKYKEKSKSAEISDKSNMTLGFDIDNNITYKPIDNLDLNLYLNYKNYITSYYANHDAVANVGLKYNKRLSNFLFNTRNNITYRMLGLAPNKFNTKKLKDDKFEQLVGNYIMFLSESDMYYLNENWSTKLSLNIYSELEFNKFRKNKLVLNEKYKEENGKDLELVEESEDLEDLEELEELERKPKKKKNGKGKNKTGKNKGKGSKKQEKKEEKYKLDGLENVDYFTNLTYINPGFKVNYQKNKLNILFDINGYFAIDSFKNPEKFYAILNENEIKYSITPKIDLIGNLKLDYRKNYFSLDEMDNFKDYIENKGLVIFKYYRYRDYEIKQDTKENKETKDKKETNEYIENRKKYFNGDKKEFDVKDTPKKMEILTIKPVISTDFKVTSSFSIKPSIGAKINIFKETDNKINKEINALLDLQIKYLW